MKTAIGHTNVYSSYGWLILARVMVLYVPNAVMGMVHFWNPGRFAPESESIRPT